MAPVMNQPAPISALARRIEAILFIAARPVAAEELAIACGTAAEDVAEALAELARDYASGSHGVELCEVAGGVAFAVARDCEPAAEAFAGARRPDDLSPALIETLSVVAYLQPTTRAEVARVRGVSSEWALISLEERGLVEECGRGESPGAPILYGTTSRFLTLFGLRGLADLPSLESFAPGVGEVDELRERLLSLAERREL